MGDHNVVRGWDWRRWARVGDPWLRAARDTAASAVAFAGAAKIRALPKPTGDSPAAKCAQVFGVGYGERLFVEGMAHSVEAAINAAMCGMTLGQLNDWRDHD